MSTAAANSTTTPSCAKFSFSWSNGPIKILRGIGNHWLWGWLWHCVCHWLRSCESPRDRKGHRSLFGLFKCRLNVFRDWLRSGVCRWSGRCHWRLLDLCNCCKLHALGHWLWNGVSHWDAIGHRCMLGLGHWLRSGICCWSDGCLRRLPDICNCCRLDALGHWLWSGVSHWGSMVHRRLLEVLSRWLRSGVCRWSDGCHRRLLDVSNCCKLNALGHWLWSSESHCGGIGHRCLPDSFNSLLQ